MEARAEPDFTAYQERNKEEKEKKNFCLTREKRKEVDDVLLPGLMSSRTPNKSAQGLLQSQTEAEERFHSFHTSYRKIRMKKKRCILALDSKTCWGSVFNLEDKTICPTGVGVFVGHRNKLSSTEDISKSNCPRLSKV